MRKFTRTLVAGAAATIAFSGLPMVTSAAHADPSCIVSAGGSPGRQSFTLQVRSNPCSRQVRAYVECVKESGGTFNAYGPTITRPGSSKADCGFAYVNKHGHEVNVPGQGWTRYTY
ncbi:hypothetical protein ACFU5O_16460 [Streptomyces sp. NPDC057445]|uniref:hypothetical protein n=1 Tax=Streptomyces sp. NPDC057445 TaxID=3346136 RepID=UPI0036C05085